MNFSLNLANLEIYIIPILGRFIFGLAIVISFLFAQKFMNKELRKLRFSDGIDKIMILASGLILSALMVIVCVRSANYILEMCGGGAYILCEAHAGLAIIFSLLSTLSYAATAPDNRSYLRFFNTFDQNAPVVYKKFLRIIIVSFLMTTTAAFGAEWDYFLSGATAIYYFLEIKISKKLIDGALNLKKPPENSFPFKFVAYINAKIDFLCLIGMFLAIFTRRQPSNTLFFENLKNIHCVVFGIFFVQAVISQIINKFMERLDAIEAEKSTQSIIQRRQKNLIFICGSVATAFYFCAVCALLAYVNAGLGERIFHDKVVIVGGIILAAVVAYKGFNEFTAAILEKAESETNNTEYRIKLQTFLPTVSAIFYVILFITSALLALANLGVNVAPILATFTVFSAAVGFAAQDIIRSFLHGITFLVEEDLYVGAYVKINGMNGTIEKLSARVLYLRGDDGTLYTIPYNVVNTIANLSRTYSYYYGALHVHNGDDIEKVSKILREVVANMKKEENYRDVILEEAEIYGLTPFDLSGLKICWRVKTSPDAHGVAVKYEIHNRLYHAYKKCGITIPTANYIINAIS
jgi:small-conductance mechanosensitive channel